MKALITSLLIFASISFAETGVVFETLFPKLPAGWYNDEWEFSSDGAYFGDFCSPGESLEGTMGSLADPEVWYFVPDGTDSLVINLNYEYNAVLATGYVITYVRMHYLSGGSMNLYYFSEGPSLMQGGIDSVECVLTELPDDTWIGFTAYGKIWNVGYPGFTNYAFWITRLSATAHGEELSLISNSWGAIKSSY